MAIIVPSAYKHGISDDDMLHALRNPVWVENLDEGFTMSIGSARDGALLEIGVVDGDSGPAVIHADRAPATWKVIADATFNQGDPCSRRPACQAIRRP